MSLEDIYKSKAYVETSVAIWIAFTAGAFCTIAIYLLFESKEFLLGTITVVLSLFYFFKAFFMSQKHLFLEDKKDAV